MPVSRNVASMLGASLLMKAEPSRRTPGTFATLASLHQKAQRPANHVRRGLLMFVQSGLGSLQYSAL